MELREIIKRQYILGPAGDLNLFFMIGARPIKNSKGEVIALIREDCCAGIRRVLECLRDDYSDRLKKKVFKQRKVSKRKSVARTTAMLYGK